MRKNLSQIVMLILVVFSLFGCGGGGGGDSNSVSPGSDSGSGSDNGGSGNGGTNPPPATSSMTMVCVEGAGWQCSGSEILKRENGVTLTRSGVQVYGKSLNETAEEASGLTLDDLSDVAKAEIRVRKSGTVVSNPRLLLSNLGISWDRAKERPMIIDTFNATQGRTVLNADGTIKDDVPLPPYTDISFYDYATKGRANATQANYANNRYFPRAEDPRPCVGDCQKVEVTTPFATDSVDNVGHAKAVRQHGDGDVHAGDAADGGWLEGGSGHGVPAPGSKGFRSFENWSLQYANLTGWVTQDTVDISEWIQNGGAEHNQNRRGMVAFGDVTAPSSVPTSGTVTYTGTAYGWTNDATYEEPNFKSSAATIVVNYATRVVTATISGLPSGTLTVSATLGTGDNANYFTGSAGSGGLSGRLFGPASGSAPSELAGVFSLPGTPLIGGFIARKE